MNQDSDRGAALRLRPYFRIGTDSGSLYQDIATLSVKERGPRIVTLANIGLAIAGSGTAGSFVCRLMRGATFAGNRDNGTNRDVLAFRCRIIVSAEIEKELHQALSGIEDSQVKRRLVDLAEVGAAIVSRVLPVTISNTGAAEHLTDVPRSITPTEADGRNETSDNSPSFRAGGEEGLGELIEIMPIT
ncbi:MAG: hypothetical protein D4R84_09745 [Rhodocyclaceae bacterium]|nr:MAG: hypothetical protein D4R84_09745 [Rhodocyclaceae bacterium]